MENPLTRQARPDTFEPKIAELYRQLFDSTIGLEQEDSLPSEGFWREFYLLKPDKQRLFDILDPFSADRLLHLQTYTRLFFRRCIEEAGSGLAPRNENALENLTGFLCAVLSKRYTNPSTDVIEILAGLNSIDKLMSDLVQGLDTIIRQSTSPQFRQKAVQTALAMVSASYQTSLVTYFIHRDMFPGLMKFVQETQFPKPEVLVLLGLLANYNKFESQNVYQNRLEDFVNANTIQHLVQDVIHVNMAIQNEYVAVLDDAPVAWTLSSTLNMVLPRALTPEMNKPNQPTEDEQKVLFNTLPKADAAALLAMYSFVQANRIFASDIISTKISDKGDQSALAAFISSSSYLCHHAHRNTQSHNYAVLSLITMRVLVEDTIHAKLLCSPESKIVVRLARQRPPFLPYTNNARMPAATILDVCTDTLSHNLRKRLSVPLYHLTLSVSHRIIAYLDVHKIRLTHHWAYVWGSLFSLLRFLTQYSTDLSASVSVSQLRTDICTPLTTLLALCLARGDNFLADPASYDDLYYKLIEATPILIKFKNTYAPPASSAPANRSDPFGPTSSDRFLTSINALLAITSHYQSLLTSKSGKSNPHQSPAAIQKIIKEGYETLPDLATPTISASGTGASTVNPGKIVDFGSWEKWRESDWKGEIKKIIRGVVEDGKLVALMSK